ncbi:SH3 domain-containing protein [Nitrosomonas sp. Nm84]|uniref:SH3 domain-containing protein n=1 Tax=Nitrosomonas sp. Nm84 TaxID=200124 RepID=UPI000D76974F|nr:SH3 domain-containing protein [Nitrosomonas sp. Nm84]
MMKLLARTMSFSLSGISSRGGYALLAILFVVTLFGCVFPKEPQVLPVVEPISAPVSHGEELRNEIARLEKIIAEKDELIKNQKIRQQSQAHVLRETNKEATRAQVKLHRLATKPGTASAIAEVEASLEHLKQAKISSFDQILQTQAQRLLETATLFYSKDQYAAAMNHVAQANNFISLILDQSRKKVSHIDHFLLEFHIPVRLRTNKNVSLRKEPNAHAQVLSTLKKDTVLVANANQGPWLRVQSDKLQGWVLHTAVEREESRNPEKD